MSKKSKQPWLANHENVGGAHLILSDYKEVLATKRQEPTYESQRLRHNRAARQTVQAKLRSEHLLNVYHLNRRIEDMYSVVERRKNINDPTVHPVYQSRPHHQHTTGLHQQLTEPWQRGYGYNTLDMAPRPGSAPSGWVSRRRRHSGDHYQGWSVTNNLRDTFWGDEFPLTRYVRAPTSTDTDHAIYKAAIKSEMVASRLYKNQDLKALFKSYLKLAPLHDKQVVERVVAELKLELHVD